MAGTGMSIELNRKEVDQRFLNNLIQQTEGGKLTWYCEGDDQYICHFPRRVLLDPLKPKELTAVDINLHPDHLTVVSTIAPAPTNPDNLVLAFTRLDYSTQLDRLTQLVKAQYNRKSNEQYALLVGGFFKD
jgi:hypothetical protein